MEYKHLKLSGPLARPAVDEATRKEQDERREQIAADMAHAALVATLRAGETPRQAKRRRARLGMAGTP